MGGEGDWWWWWLVEGFMMGLGLVGLGWWGAWRGADGGERGLLAGCWRWGWLLWGVRGALGEDWCFVWTPFLPPGPRWGLLAKYLSGVWAGVTILAGRCCKMVSLVQSLSAKCRMAVEWRGFESCAVAPH